MELVADRFVAMNDGRVIDLSDGAEVVLITSTADGPSEQMHWTIRCDSFSRLHHPAIARLIDYGVFGKTRRFEAWRSGARWRGARTEAERTLRAVASFLRASGLTAAQLSLDAVRACGSRAIVLPDAASGYETQPAETPVDLPLDACGLSVVARPAVAAVAEIFAQPVTAGPRTIALWCPRGGGLRTVVEELSRAARLNGFVPLSSGVAEPRILELLTGRSLFLIDRLGGGKAWRTLLEATVRSPRAHVLLLPGREEVPRVHGLALEQLTPSALVDAVRPVDLAGPIRRRIETAAGRAGGLPGRFAGLLWGHPVAVSPVRRFNPGSLRVAEQPALYGADVPPLADTVGSAELSAWPAAGELTALRRRMDAGIQQIDAGRHAPGDRALRYAIAGLARRHDWPHAARGALALATSLLKRGHPQDAHAILADAQSYTAKADQDGLSMDVAILSGRMWTDLGRLDEAESVLQAAIAAARSTEEPARMRHARLALTRCLFWRGRYGEAAGLVASMSMDHPEMADPSSVSVAIASSRIAVGCRDLRAAVGRATKALEAAEQIGEPALVMRAAYGAAFAHLAVGDRPSVDRDVGTCIRAARAARDPLSALRARLLGAESARREGRKGTATALLGRVRGMSGSKLPLTVRARCALLSDLLAGASPVDVVRRHVTATRLEALALFAPVADGGAVSSSEQTAVDDVVEILRSCQAADDDAAVLAAVCARLRVRLNAAAVAFFVREGGTHVPLASDGSSRLDPTIAERVLAAAQPIAPHSRQEVIEGGTPVRYAGHTLGALVARWTLGAGPDGARASILLTLAATAAGPALAGAIARRAAPPARGMDELLGVSVAIAEVRRAVDRAAAAPFAVLIEGESGSGKELVARALHRRSPRRDRPFCTLNCAALPDDLVEAELFGHARGAYTGAVAERSGVFEEAHTGTLFLDEIGELSPRAQAKVLRTVQEGELRRVGENVARRIDVRIVSATNRDLCRDVADGRFRRDLLYRLDVIRITLPPLRERREDIAVLGERWWREATARVGSRAVLSAATVAALARYDWPGNVRELQNVLAALAVRSPRRGVIPPTALPPVFGASQAGGNWHLDEARRSFEESFVRAALVRSGGHRSRAAEELGVTRQGLTKLMARLGIR